MAERHELPHISVEEYASRRERVRVGMEKAGVDALCVFYAARVAYLTGFHHIPTERLVALILAPDDGTILVVPAVEKEHAESVPAVDRVDVYHDYPGIEPPIKRVAGILTELKVKPTRTGADHDGYVPHWGYHGPLLSDLTGARPVNGEMLVESLRRAKSPAELACMQLSCDWSVRAHRRMHAAIEIGKTEMECYLPATNETVLEMNREMPGYRPRGLWLAPFPATGGWHGLSTMFQAGRSTAMPHGFVRGRGIQKGDVLITGTAAEIDGYRCELERTMFVGDPTTEQERAFAKMLALQDRAIEVMAPGVPIRDVELAVMQLAEEIGVRENLRHHVGHSIGLEGHEAPFLDRGEDALLEPGMVFSVEPGVYLKDLGGFRHSDTVAITKNGHAVMTQYPRNLRDVIIPA